MKIFFAALVFLAVATSAAAQSNEPSPHSVQVLSMGEVDGPRMREMRGRQCGPSFSFSPTDSYGAGLLYFVVREPDGQKLKTAITGGVQIRKCEKCQAPMAWERGGGNFEIAISPEQLKLSCLKDISVSK